MDTSFFSRWSLTTSYHHLSPESTLEDDMMVEGEDEGRFVLPQELTETSIKEVFDRWVCYYIKSCATPANNGYSLHADNVSLSVIDCACIRN